MGDVMCCPLEGSFDDEPATVHNVSRPRAAKDHRCSECGETIVRGSEYELVKGCWDGAWLTFRTCLSCVEIRNHFGCDGWVYGQVWGDLEENFFPDMKAGGPCMDGLSPEAKARLFEKRTEWLFESEREVDGAPPPEVTHG